MDIMIVDSIWIVKGYLKWLVESMWRKRVGYGWILIR